MSDSTACANSILTVKDIQKILRIGQVSTYTLVRSKVFPVVHIGRSYRIPRDTFFEWLRQTNPPAKAIGIAITDSTCILSKIKNGGKNDGNQKF